MSIGIEEYGMKTISTLAAVNGVEILREAIGTRPSFELGTVIRFDSISRSRGVEQVFNYAALYADDMRWYLTGVNKHYGDRLSTTEFLEVLKHEDVTSIKIASGWDHV